MVLATLTCSCIVEGILPNRKAFLLALQPCHLILVPFCNLGFKPQFLTKTKTSRPGTGTLSLGKWVLKYSRCIIFIFFFFTYSKSNLLLFTRTKVWGRTEKSIPKWDACTRVFHALRWNKANLFLPNGYWLGWEMTKRWDQLTTPFCSATTENWTQKNSANTSLFLPVR